MRGFRFLFLLFVPALAATLALGFGGTKSAHADVTERTALWAVVQACKLNHRVTGGAFPCLSVVEPSDGSGYAVIRAPADEVKVIVTPTVRTIGIESSRLRGPQAPNYFADAWAARHFATDGLTEKPSRGDLALAINSKPGRSQDQLHIHVACIRQEVKRKLAHQTALLRAKAWIKLKPTEGSPVYAAHFVPGDLAKINVFDLVADGLKTAPAKMDQVTVVVVGIEAGPGPAGFAILARQKIPHSSDEAHGEHLLDQVCAPFRGS